LSQHFAKRGYVCVSINYRLGIPFPIDQNNAMKAVFRATQDMKAAIRFMRKDAATANQYKIDPATIFGGGSSAGAFTALHAAYLDEYSELPAQLDTTVMGSIEGNSGTPGYSSGINAVIDLCGALGNKTWIHPGDVPFVAMHGTNDGTVPYGTALIYVLGAFPVMVVDGSYSIAGYADTIGVANDFYTYFGADHVPYVTSTAYMDTTVRFVSNFLYRYLGCNPVDPTPFPNTFSTGVNEFAFDKGVNVFPNPASEFIQIDLNDPINRVELIDMSGRTILLRVPDADHRISLQNISQGVYVMHITSKNFNAIRKIVIE
jgi:hypothetical protein